MNITDIFISIFNASITASIIALAVISVRLIFRKAPKFLTVLLWAMVAIRLVCPFSVESRMSLMPRQDFIQPETVYSGTSEKPDLGEIFSSVTAENPVDYEFTINDGSLQLSEITAPDEEHINPLLIMSSVMSVVWVFGLCGMLLYALISFLRLKKTVSSAISVRENEYICDDIKTPFILGVIRPKIYLPSDMDEETASCVIAHEKAHIKRRDHLWKPLGFILLSVYWFNPVMWLSYVLLCRDIELACDEKVIRQMEGKGKKAYSKALLSCSAPRSMITACPVAFGEVGVKQRIKSVLSYKKPAFWVIIASVAASVIVALCFMTDPVDKTNGGKNYISVYEIEEGSFSEMEETLSTSNMLKVRKGEKEYFNATPLGGGSSNVIGFLESLSLGSTQEREFNFAEVDGCITVLGDTYNGVEIYFAKDYSRLWLRSLADSSYSSVYVVLNVEQARNFFENREYLNDVAIWEFDSLSSADGHRKLYFYLDNEYELAESTNVIESEEHGLKGISWSPNNASVSSYLEESSTIYAVRNGENVELTVTMTKVGENEHGGVYFRISADEDTVLSGYGNGYEYVLGKVESDNSEDDTSCSDVLNGEVSENHISENVISGSNLDAAVSEAILSINSKYSWLGECPAEGHIIMGTDKEGDKTKAYVLEAYSSYGFDNGWFIELGGHRTACVMTFLETDNGYVFQGVEYTEDGAHLKDSVKRLFPLRYRKRAISFNEEDRQSLTEQCRKYAAAYLEEKGRTEKIGSYGDVERISLTDLGVSVEASNRILEQKGNISYCHIGYYEELQDGVRYLCRTGYSETENIVVYIKERYDTGQIAEITVFDSLTGEIITDEQPDNMEYFYGKVLSVDKNEKYALVEPIENSKLSNTVEKVYVSLDFDSKVKTPDLYDGLYIMVLYKGKAPDSDSKTITMDGTSAIYLYADMNYKGNPALKNNKQEHTTKAVAA